MPDNQRHDTRANRPECWPKTTRLPLLNLAGSARLRDRAWAQGSRCRDPGQATRLGMRCFASVVAAEVSLITFDDGDHCCTNHVPAIRRDMAEHFRRHLLERSAIRRRSIGRTKAIDRPASAAPATASATKCSPDGVSTVESDDDGDGRPQYCPCWGPEFALCRHADRNGKCDVKRWQSVVSKVQAIGSAQPERAVPSRRDNGLDGKSQEHQRGDRDLGRQVAHKRQHVDGTAESPPRQHNSGLMAR